jgi:Cys-rich protein (TIGR01571 family)
VGPKLWRGGAGAHRGGGGVNCVGHAGVYINAICYEHIMPKLTEDWKVGLCCNSEWRICCLACVAPCIPYYVNLSSMKEQHFDSTIPTPSDYGGACIPACIHGSSFYAGTVGPCIFSCTNAVYVNMPVCLFTLPCVMHCVTRRYIRTGYNIKGGCCEDCCTVVCCYSCALAQEMAQLDSLVKPPKGVNSMDGQTKRLVSPPIDPRDVKGEMKA